MTRFSSTISTFMLSHFPHSDVILSIRSVMGSGSGVTRMSHFFKMAGSTSKYSGLIRILPGPSGNMVVSMCFSYSSMDTIVTRFHAEALWPYFEIGPAGTVMCTSEEIREGCRLPVATLVDMDKGKHNESSTRITTAARF